MDRERPEVGEQGGDKGGLNLGDGSDLGKKGIVSRDTTEGQIDRR